MATERTSAVESKKHEKTDPATRIAFFFMLIVMGLALIFVLALPFML